MRDSYLFDLARLCGIRPWETWELTVIPEFQVLTDSIDHYLKTEAQRR